jgi:allantoinase
MTTVMNLPVLFVTGQNVLLPEQDAPLPATIKVDLTTGKIIEIYLGCRVPGAVKDGAPAQWIDAGVSLILPGLVECVACMRSP